MSLTDDLYTPRRPAVDADAVEDLYRKLLEALGEDPGREGLRETPRRVAEWWCEFLDHDLGRCDAVFDHTAVGDQWVAVSGITAWSLCEHHLLPFSVTMTCGYAPVDEVIGLSKIARIVSGYAHRLQLQERLTTQVAQAIAEVTGSPDVGVWSTFGEHLCMTMRGVRAEGARTSTWCLLGRLRTDPALVDRLLAASSGSRHRP